MVYSKLSTINIRLVPDLSPLQLEWRNNPNVMRWCRQTDFITQKQQERWEPVGMYGIQAKKNGNTQEGYPYEIWWDVGTCGLTAPFSHHRDHGTAEYSLFIAPEHRGKGYATEALHQLVDWGFRNFAWLRRIEGDIFADNLASLHIAEKVGFTVEGRLRGRYFKEGKRVDSIMVSVLREEWQIGQRLGSPLESLSSASPPDSSASGSGSIS